MSWMKVTVGKVLACEILHHIGLNMIRIFHCKLVMLYIHMYRAFFNFAARLIMRIMNIISIRLSYLTVNPVIYIYIFPSESVDDISS